MNKPPDTATPPASTKELTDEERSLEGINADYKEKFGFHDPESGYAYKARRGSAARSSRTSPSTRRAAVDAGVPPQGARALHGSPDAAVGRQPEPDRLG